MISPKLKINLTQRNFKFLRFLPIITLTK